MDKNDGLILYKMKQHITKCDKLSLVRSFNFSLLSIQLGLNTQKHVCVRSDGNNTFVESLTIHFCDNSRIPFSTMIFIWVFLFSFSHSLSPFICISSAQDYLFIEVWCGCRDYEMLKNLSPAPYLTHNAQSTQS